MPVEIRCTKFFLSLCDKILSFAKWGLVGIVPRNRFHFSLMDGTMNRLSSFFLGIVVGAVGIVGAENFYIVRSNETFHLVPKIAARLEFPYRDIRGYTVQDWQNNQALALAIIKSQKQDLMAESGLSNMQKQFESILRSLTGS